MNSFQEVLDKWPSMADLADDLGEKIHTVRKWHSRNRIPSSKWTSLIEAGKKRHIKITPRMLTDFSARCGNKAA